MLQSGLNAWICIMELQNQNKSKGSWNMEKISGGKLMSYISFVKNLEVSIYEQQKVLASLNNGIVTTYSTKEFRKKYDHKSFLGQLFNCCMVCSMLAASISALIAFFHNYTLGSIILSLFGEDELFGPIWKAIKAGFFIGIAIGILLAVIIWMKDVIEVRNENKEIKQYNAEVDKENRIKAQTINKKNELLSYEIDIIKKNMNKTKKILDHTYSMNIIHEKYRYNVVYICSIYEYFDTGRCNRLEGHEGAYNLLESDIKYHTILDKLDIIITKLDEIKNSQRELYTAITNTKESIQQVNSSINGLLGTMNNVQDSLNQIAYNSRIASQNGEFLKWYAYFRT